MCRKTSAERDHYEERHHKTTNVLLFLVQPVFFCWIYAHYTQTKRGLTPRLYWKIPLNALKRM